ncbi:hypothetical protein ACJX0J_040159 [Zea mays]
MSSFTGFIESIFCISAAEATVGLNHITGNTTKTMRRKPNFHLHSSLHENLKILSWVQKIIYWQQIGLMPICFYVLIFKFNKKISFSFLVYMKAHILNNNQSISDVILYADLIILETHHHETPILIDIIISGTWHAFH